jgi:hypothetical protein
MATVKRIAGMETARWRERARDPVLTALAALLAIVAFVSSPLLAAGVLAAYAFNVALWLLIVAAVAVLSRRAIAVTTTVLAIAWAAIDIERTFGTSTPGFVYLGMALACAFLLILIGAVASAVFAPGRVTYHRIMGAVVLYMAIAYLFAVGYHLLAAIVPGAFAGIEPQTSIPTLIASLTYFSYVTLTSTGYGDIAPVHPIARSLANLEAVVGQPYPATLLARLVTLHAESRRR